jgi:hypothetical protein
MVKVSCTSHADPGGVDIIEKTGAGKPELNSKRRGGCYREGINKVTHLPAKHACHAPVSWNNLTAVRKMEWQFNKILLVNQATHPPTSASLRKTRHR